MICYYDLAFSPPTYDIVAFLSAVEQERIKRGEEQVQIIVLPGPAGGFRQDKFWPHDIAGRQHMLDHVALPMARMLPGVTVELATERPKSASLRSIGFGRGLYGLQVHAQALREGIRPLRPRKDLERSTRLVTITLREADHWPERNSNIGAWTAAATLIQDRGFDVRVIRDTKNADEPLTGLTTDPAASRDLERRAQVYRSAAANFFVSNGCAWFAMALDAPVTILKPATEGLNRSCSASYFRQCGIRPGGQIPGSPSHQRLVWQEDNLAAILDAFEDQMELAA